MHGLTALTHYIYRHYFIAYIVLGLYFMYIVAFCQRSNKWQ